MLDFLRFYNRSQRYRARIDIRAKNNGKASKKASFLIPLPMNTDYQIVEPAFQESFLIREIELGVGEEESISIPFDVQVAPRKSEVVDARIKGANEFVLSYLRYGNPIKGLYTAEEAREKREVDCGGFDTLLQDELSKQGINSKVVSGFWAGYPKNTMHAWLEIEGAIPADPSIEYLRRHGRTKKSGHLGFVGSDRIAFSTWQPGDKFLQHPIMETKDKDIFYETNFYCTRA